MFHCFAFCFTDFVLAMPCLFLYVSLCCQHNTYYMQLLNWTNPLVPEKQSSDVTLNMSGPSTIEKRNRKKRKAKVISPQEKISKMIVEPHVQEFYKKYLANKFFKNGNK